jgi:hypothetical protein
MKRNLINGLLTLRLISLFWFVLLFPESTKAKDAILTIHLRGVYESTISLLTLTGPNALKPVITVEGAKSGVPVILKVSENMLPGEFVLRFDYKENSASTSYPSEKRIIIYKQDIELWVHPIYCNNTDSTWFQKDERENTAYVGFLRENARQKEKLGLLQNFLMNYDDTNSSFYSNGITEYEKRRIANNQWIAAQTKQYRELFVSSIFGFNRIPPVSWVGSESDRKSDLREKYFDEMDFSDTLMLKTANMKEWMDGYVNLYGELATSISLRDSLFTFAGKTAIEKGRTGHPLVYGWMVDYFFTGYESFNIEQGIKMLQPYLDDPDCLTSKRQAINRRLKGIETLVPGTTAPNVIMPDAGNNLFELYSFPTGKNYILLLFWSADCGHCNETVGKLYPWYQQPGIMQKIDIVAISIDETDTEIQAWQQKINDLKGWTHMRAAEGVRSKVAGDYSILGIPVMILLNAKTKEILASPDSAEKLILLISS